MDPIDLRIRNEPDKDPTSSLPFSSRHIVEAWRSGAERFDWDRRGTTPGAARGRVACRHGPRDRDLSLYPDTAPRRGSL